MPIKIIVAATMNDVIGRSQQGDLPFKLADDLKRFKEKTWGSPVVCGSTTYFSLPAKARPLPGRENIVITRDPSKLKWEKVLVVTSLDEILERSCNEDLWVIGGAAVYRQVLPLASEMHLTRVQAILRGDVLFPPWNASEWTLISQESVRADKRNQYNFSWEVWRRLSSPPASM